MSGRAACVWAVNVGTKESETGAQSLYFSTLEHVAILFFTSLLAYVSVSACICEELWCQDSPRGMNILSCMFLGTTLLRFWSVQSFVNVLNFHMHSHLSTSMNVAVMEGGQSLSFRKPATE